MTRRNFMITMAAFSGAVWVLYGVLGRTLAGALDARFGRRVLQMAAGKTTDSRVFIEMRLHDAVVILSAAALIALAQLLAATLIKRRASPRWAWILSALSGFVCLNVFAVVAAHTV